LIINTFEFNNLSKLNSKSNQKKSLLISIQNKIFTQSFIIYNKIYLNYFYFTSISFYGWTTNGLCELIRDRISGLRLGSRHGTHGDHFLKL